MSVVTLTDSTSGATARIVPSMGFNLFSLRVPRDGRELELLWHEPGFETGRGRPTRSGIPILFPFPGRLRGMALNWEGQQYEQPVDDERGNAIHGLVFNRPWRVVEQTECRAVGQFQLSIDLEDGHLRWPTDFRLTTTYVLDGSGVTGMFEIFNPGSRPLPCGLGLHPYFAVPLGGDSADACLIQIPAGARWELQKLLPTGQVLPLDPEEARRLHEGVPFGSTQYDDVLTALDFHDGWCSTAVYDPQTDLKLTVRFSDGFRECVVFNPPHREAICIEPYTCVPNAAELSQQGIDTGLRLLQPAESLQLAFRIELD